MTDPRTSAILFVCTGNICRSPTAEGVLRRKLSQAGLAHRVMVDSAGTHDYHVGDPPDPRSQRHASKRGYDLSGLRARQLMPCDFERFDLLLALDRSHLAHMRAMTTPAMQGKLKLLMSFAPGEGMEEVPDPYYGGADGFERVLDLIEAATQGLLAAMQRGLA